MRHLAVGGGQIAWRETGAGRRTIVWVHGLPLDSRSWALQERHFISRARSVFLDLRGYGFSDELPDPTNDVTELYVEDLHALIIDQGLTNVVLVGFASGGHVALRYAAHHPETLGHLVTINASPRFRRGTDWPWGFDDAGIAHFTDAARDGGIQGLTDAVLDPSIAFRDVDPPTAERLRTWFSPMSLQAGVRTLLGFFDGIANDDDRDLLPAITTPTLLIAGTAGQEVPSDVALYLRNHISNARLVELPGVDHFAFATRAELINHLIEQVL